MSKEIKSQGDYKPLFSRLESQYLEDQRLGTSSSRILKFEGILEETMIDAKLYTKHSFSPEVVDIIFTKVTKSNLEFELYFRDDDHTENFSLTKNQLVARNSEASALTHVCVISFYIYNYVLTDPLNIPIDCHSMDELAWLSGERAGYQFKCKKILKQVDSQLRYYPRLPKDYKKIFAFNFKTSFSNLTDRETFNQEVAEHEDISIPDQIDFTFDFLYQTQNGEMDVFSTSGKVTHFISCKKRFCSSLTLQDPFFKIIFCELLNEII